MLSLSLLYILAIGLSGTAAFPNPSAFGTSASTTAPRPAATHPRCADRACPAHDKIVWDSNLQACVCRWPLDPIGKCPLVCPEGEGLTFDEDTDTCFCEEFEAVPLPIASGITARQTGVDASTCPLFVKCSNGYHAFFNETTKFCGCVLNEPVPDPRTCPMIRCRSGFHPFYNATKETCVCSPDDGEANCIAATECLIGHHPVWDNLTETCACVENEVITSRDVDPSTCPNTWCTVSYSAVFDPATQTCSCVPHTALCGPSAPYCAADSDFNITTCTCQLKNPIPASCKPIPCPSAMHMVYHPETKQCTCDVSCTSIGCIAEEHPIYNSTTNSCYCGGYNGEKAKRETPEAVEECSKKRYCAADSTWNTTSCSCELNNPIPSTCQELKCKHGTHCVYHPEDDICSCDISCVGLDCLLDTNLFYNSTDNTCSCELRSFSPAKRAEEPKGTCPLPFCASGSTFNNTTCTCEITNPIPPTCPQMKCKPNTHIVYHPDEKKCTCDVSCPDLMCIAEMHPMLNETANTCACAYIPGLEPPSEVDPPPPTAVQRDVTTNTALPIPELPCRNFFCVSEKRPVFNTTSHGCSCEWIPGLNPNPPLKPRLPFPASPTPTPSCSSTICTPENTPVFSPSLGACTCAPLPGQEPVPMCPDTVCVSEMQPVFNSAIQECECDWIPGLAPSCTGTICIPEKQAVPDARGVCSCQWIPGLESRSLPVLESRYEELEQFEREVEKGERELIAGLGERESNSIPACYFNPPCPDEDQKWEWEDGGCVCVPVESTTTTSESRTRTKTSSSSTRSVSFSCTPTATPNTMKTWTRTKSRTVVPTTTTNYV